MPPPARSGLLFLVLLAGLGLHARQSMGHVSVMVGEGPELLQPFVLEVNRDGTLTVLDSSQGMVLDVDPATGDRRMIAGGRRQMQAGLSAPTGAVRHRDGSYSIVDGGRHLLYRLWPNLDRVLVLSGAGVRGVGPPFRMPGRMSRLSSGRLLVVDRDLPGLLEVDPVTGDRRELTGPGRGGGPALREPDDLVVTLQGRIFVADNLLGAVLEVDAATGNRRVALDVRHLPGPRLFRPYALGLGPEGTLLVAHPNLARALSWNPETGETRLLTTPERGRGVLMADLEDLATLPGGDVVCADARSGTLVRLGPDGVRSVLSGRTLPHGRLQAMIYAFAREEGDDAIGVDGLGGRLLRFSTASGRFRTVSATWRGRGPSLELPNEVAVDGHGRAFVVDWDSGLVEVDLATGDRRQLLAPTPAFTPYDVQAGSEGRLFLLDALTPQVAVLERSGALRVLVPRGGGLEAPLRLAWTPHGRLLVTDSGQDTLFEVDPVSGALRDLSRGGVAPGPRAVLLEAVAPLSGGGYVVSDDDRGALLAVGRSGARSLLSGRGRGTGPRLDAPEDVAECRDGRLLVCDPGLPGLLRVDPASGDRSVLFLSHE